MDGNIAESWRCNFVCRYVGLSQHARLDDMNLPVRCASTAMTPSGASASGYMVAQTAELPRQSPSPTLLFHNRGLSFHCGDSFRPAQFNRLQVVDVVKKQS